MYTNRPEKRRTLLVRGNAPRTRTRLRIVGRELREILDTTQQMRHDASQVLMPISSATGANPKEIGLGGGHVTSELERPSSR